MAIGSEGTNLLNDRYRRLLSKIFGKWGSFPTSLKVEPLTILIRTRMICVVLKCAAAVFERFSQQH